MINKNKKNLINAKLITTILLTSTTFLISSAKNAFSNSTITIGGNVIANENTYAGIYFMG